MNEIQQVKAVKTLNRGIITGGGIIIALAGLTILFGWVANIPSFSRLWFSNTAIASSTGLCFIPTGLYIVFLQLKATLWNRLRLLISIFLTVIPILILAEHLWDIHFEMNHIFPGCSPMPSESGMSVFTACSFLIIGISSYLHRKKSEVLRIISIFLLSIVFSYGLYNALVIIMSIGSPEVSTSLYPSALGTSVLFLFTAAVLLISEIGITSSAFPALQVIFLGLSITLFLMYQIEILAYNRAKYTVNVIRSVKEIHMIQQGATALRTEIIENQNAVRGFVLTSNPALFDRATHAGKQIMTLYENLDTLVAGKSKCQMRLDSAKTLIDLRLRFSEEVLNTYIDQGREEAVRKVRNGMGSLLVDQISAQMDSIYSYQDVLLTAKIDQGILLTNKMFELVLMAIILLVAVLAAIVYQTVRFLISKQRLNVALFEAHTITRLAIEKSNAGTWEWDMKKNKFVWSSELKLLCGIQTSNEPGFETLLGMVHPEDVEWVRTELPQAVAGKTPLSIEFGIIMPDGSTRWLKVSGQFTKRDDLPATYNGICFDITDIKEKEAEIKSKNYVLRMAGKTALFGVWTYDVLQNTLDWSDEVRDIIEAPPDFMPVILFNRDVQGRSYDGSISKLIRECVKTGHSFDAISQIETLKGNQIYIRTTGDAIRDKNGTVVSVMGSVQNVDNLKKTEDQLRSAKKEAEIANSAKSDFLLNVSHEFRTPLNAVIGFAEIIKKTEGPVKIEFAESIKSSGQRLLTMVNDILDLIRSENENIELERDYYETRVLLSEVIKSYQPKASEKGLNLSVVIDPDLPGYLYIDGNRLRQVIMHLVDNAVKYTDKGGVELKAYDAPSEVYSDRINLTIEVNDTGKGIPEEFQQKLFRIFSQVERKTVLNGIGIGLALTKRYIDMMEGTIRLISQPGMGSNFMVTIPDIHFRTTGYATLKEEESNSVESTQLLHNEEITGIEMLLAALKGSYSGVCARLEHRQPIEEVRQFGISLVELGNTHHCDLITNYGYDLLQAAENFDIDAILKLIGKYNQNIILLETGQV